MLNGELPRGQSKRCVRMATFCHLKTHRASYRITMDKQLRCSSQKLRRHHPQKARKIAKAKMARKREAAASFEANTKKYIVINLTTIPTYFYYLLTI